MYNLTKCALCGNEAELELSHTVPKMAVRTLKKTAIGNIRSTENPNKTIQDSEKLYIICMHNNKELKRAVPLYKIISDEKKQKRTAPCTIV